jgi:hypothetical protein
VRHLLTIVPQTQIRRRPHVSYTPIAGGKPSAQAQIICRRPAVICSSRRAPGCQHSREWSPSIAKRSRPIRRYTTPPGCPAMRHHARGGPFEPGHASLRLGWRAQRRRFKLIRGRCPEIPYPGAGSDLPGSSSLAGLEILVLATKVRILPREQTVLIEVHFPPPLEAAVALPATAPIGWAGVAVAAEAHPSICR